MICRGAFAPKKWNTNIQYKILDWGASTNHQHDSSKIGEDGEREDTCHRKDTQEPRALRIHV